jgi:hypothetical protein
MTPDPPPPIPPDPNLIAQENQAKQDQISSLQDRTQLDTASVMARYGSRMALATAQSSGGTAPAVAAPTLVAR